MYFVVDRQRIVFVAAGVTDGIASSCAFLSRILGATAVLSDGRDVAGATHSEEVSDDRSRAPTARVTLAHYAALLDHSRCPALAHGRDHAHKITAMFLKA